MGPLKASKVYNNIVHWSKIYFTKTLVYALFGK